MPHEIRIAAFEWLHRQADAMGGVLPYSVLQKGFECRGERITLVGPQGIWKPKGMKYPLSIITTPNSPYDDKLRKDNFLEYSYRGTNPYHPVNVSLREMMKSQIPLIYFITVGNGKYMAAFPIYIMYDDPQNLKFIVAVDDDSRELFHMPPMEMVDNQAEIRRSYLTSTIQVRVHQRKFRERVIQAYRSQCALCCLRHEELLDAAHIIADHEERGEPVIQNGMSLCKIHHAAFDSNIIGITPDYDIKVREDILQEIDGPMLKYGIQSMEGNRIVLPKDRSNWPDRERLEQRFQAFLRAG